MKKSRVLEDVEGGGDLIMNGKNTMNRTWQCDFVTILSILCYLVWSASPCCM